VILGSIRSCLESGRFRRALTVVLKIQALVDFPLAVAEVVSIGPRARLTDKDRGMASALRCRREELPDSPI
jgi:hypothetical protein